MNPFLGVFLHAVGGFSSASFYVPINKVRQWAWETYWVTLGFVAWVIMPQVGGFLTTPDLWGILRESSGSSMGWSYLFGVLWGLGGLTCGLSLRYMGLSLGQSISLGFCAAFGTLIPPIFEGKIGEVVGTTSGQVVLLGIAVCLAGIVLCGWAGVLKERQLTDAQKREAIKDFSLIKGLVFATFGGVMSSCMAFAIKAGDPIAQAALSSGTDKVFINNPTYVLAMGGGFTTNFIAAMILSARNKSFGDYTLRPRTTLMSNYSLSALSGLMWYGQFFFYGMGTTQMGKYDFASWSLHMAFIIIFSNLWGVCLKEWRLVDNRTRSVLWGGIVTLIASTVLIGYGNSLAARRPNVVFILTDNQSAWTLGCYGNRDIRTPNIDRLAAEGMRFERCFSCNAVCSPTRATYLTGLIPSQHGVHSFLGMNALMGPQAFYALKEFRTLPRILNEAGYVCGLAGKWHLGDCLHPQDGFTYWVTKPSGHTSTFYDAEVIEDGAVHKEPTYLTDFWTKHAIRFIEQNKDKPFFLYLPYNGPYGLGAWLGQPGRGRHVAEYADKDLTCFPREPMHPWLRGNRQFVGNLTAMRRYSEEVTGVDDGVGAVLDALKRLKLEDDTLVIFTADQGLAGGHHGMWGMADHGRPLNTFDTPLHIPLIWRYPKHIPKGSRSDLLVSNYDFMPTLLKYLGLEDHMAKAPESPGRDYSAVFQGRTIPWDNVVFYEFENSRMVRTDRWKLTRRHPDGPDELYDLANDPGEKHNLIDKPEHADAQRQLQQRLDSFFKRYVDPKYDLWDGGTSKAPRVSRREPRTSQPAASRPASPARKGM